ncbi:hypothetical protein FACS189459_4150 [Bacilli bacterium]|nr:hypothetical protein FACS189459_4150 [Bacilli bacterium]
MTTNELDKMAGDFIISNNCIPSFLNYSGFPKNICISINEELIHGVGSDRVIRNNDLITFDIGVTYMGHICDSAFSVIVEPNNDMQKQLINNAAKKCLDESVKVAINGNYTGDIGNCIETIAKQNGYEVIKDFGGHGCGNKVHEDPHIPCYGTKGSGVKLIPGMVICIEPMLMTGSDKYYIDSLND